MPPVPVLDLSTIDLAKRLIPDDELRRILPHRGNMSLIDGIIAKEPTGDWLLGYKDARKDEFWVDGHFPGNPIMPGVVMVEAAGQLCVAFYKLTVPEVHDKLIVFGGLDDARFRGIVRPGDRLHIVAKKLEVNRRLAKCLTQAIVNGKVVYEGVIIGLPT